MTDVPRRRPRRLWLAALMNIFVAGISLALLAFLTVSSRVVLMTLSRSQAF